MAASISAQFDDVSAPYTLRHSSGISLNCSNTTHSVIGKKQITVYRTICICNFIHTVQVLIFTPGSYQTNFDDDNYLRKGKLFIIRYSLNSEVAKIGGDFSPKFLGDNNATVALLQIPCLTII